MEDNPNLEFKKIKSLQFLYEVNSNGTVFRNVKSKKHNRIVPDMHHSNTGYYFTWVCLKGKVKRVSIAQVVAECWLGDKPDGYEIDHRDRNSRNNDYRNLRYVTKSEQMKNRDHTNISATGLKNLEAARRDRMKPVKLVGFDDEKFFESTTAAARYLASFYGRTVDSMRDRLKRHRSHIFDFDVIYLNAETVHARSTEQETVH